MNGVLKVQKVFSQKKEERDSFVKSSNCSRSGQHYYCQMSLITTQNSFASNLWQFEFVFLKPFFIPRRTFNLKLGKNNPQPTSTSNCYLILQIPLSNGIQFLLIFSLNLFVLYRVCISISIAFCALLVKSSSLCKRNSGF